MKKLGGILLTLMLLLIGCAKNAPLETEALGSLEQINEHNRFYTEHNFDELPDPTYDFSNSDEEELSEETLQTLRLNHEQSSFPVTTEKMIEDVETFHLALKHMYALYEYMGGDEAFQTARDDVIDHLNGLDDDAELTQFQFINLLKNHYDFIEDTHLLIDESPMADFQYTFYASERFQFQKKDTGEFSLIGENDVILSSINGNENIEDFLKPTISDNGEIAFIVGTFSTSLTLSERDWTLVFQRADGDEEAFIELRPVTSTLARYELGDPFAFGEKEGIPWLQLRSMFLFEDAPIDYDDIIDTANHLQGEPYFVLDLRSNHGGSIIFVEKWLEAFFGESISWHSQFHQLFSNTSLTFVEDTIDFYLEHGISAQTFEEEFTDLFKIEEIEKPIEPYWETEERAFQAVDDNDTHIFILVDNNTASAGEHFVSQLKKANNTTVIGMNTRGSMISGDALMWQLPHTRIQMSVPVTFNYSPDLLEKEAIGIQPDFWVRPEQAEQRVLSFIKQHTKD
ncbi:hypothetical protein LGQ02_01245 [Bacillus shivajii]|uniref:S41 family peptidase n=1 Tax=Bacillus shivajii TaxID=1983719 RepID=UPI001CFAEA09|nr:S41 family peptidase [Bacillus shivajii]UCZ53455.1 hypothetical protein LGQ02_01245 [Bacillus shivajii]